MKPFENFVGKGEMLITAFSPLPTMFTNFQSFILDWSKHSLFGRYLKQLFTRNVNKEHVAQSIKSDLCSTMTTLLEIKGKAAMDLFLTLSLYHTILSFNDQEALRTHLGKGENAGTFLHFQRLQSFTTQISVFSS